MTTEMFINSHFLSSPFNAGVGRRGRARRDVVRGEKGEGGGMTSGKGLCLGTREGSFTK